MAGKGMASGGDEREAGDIPNRNSEARVSAFHYRKAI
jgi:hypothetical protein